MAGLTNSSNSSGPLGRAGRALAMTQVAVGLQSPALTGAQRRREQNVDVGGRFIVRLIGRYDDVADRHVLSFCGGVEGACGRLSELPPLRYGLQGQSLGETGRGQEEPAQAGLARVPARSCSPPVLPIPLSGLGEFQVVRAQQIAI